MVRIMFFSVFIVVVFVGVVRLLRMDLRISMIRMVSGIKLIKRF